MDLFLFVFASFRIWRCGCVVADVEVINISFGSKDCLELWILSNNVLY